MLALGLSGLDRGYAVKKALLDGNTSREVRMRQGLDSAAVLVDETGVLAAAAQERYDGEKGTGKFPVDAIRACLDIVGAEFSDIDVISRAFSYEPSPLWELDTFQKRWYNEAYAHEVQDEILRDAFPVSDRQRLLHTPHHLAHAASSYYLSGFPDALVFVADGMGEHDSTSLFTGEHSQLRLVNAYPVSNSLGILYGVVTHYLGFVMNMDEYKIMGLAPYGDPDRYRAEFEQFVRLRPEGGLSIPLLSANRTARERETHGGVVNRLQETLGPARAPGGELEQRHWDVAAALQRRLEEAIMHILTDYRKCSAKTNLCMAGGVALNCTANGVVVRSGLFDKVFVQPASADDGSALGAALLAVRQENPAPPVRMEMPYWGDAATAAQIDDALRAVAPTHSVRRLSEHDLIQQTIELVTTGSVVALFQGRMEFGPRALGNRSILADPRDPAMRARLNTMVKQREEFRPFAPAVTTQNAEEFFDLAGQDTSMYRHMLFVAPVRQEHCEQLPAVTHVDGSARVQVVDECSAPRFWRMLREMGRRTGYPVLVNTSFNLRGQPIVRTALDAVLTFNRSTIDAMVIGNFLVQRTTDER